MFWDLYFYLQLYGLFRAKNKDIDCLCQSFIRIRIIIGDAASRDAVTRNRITNVLSDITQTIQTMKGQNLTKCSNTKTRKNHLQIMICQSILLLM